MFGFLKKKLQEAVDIFTKKAEVEGQHVEVADQEIPLQKEEKPETVLDKKTVEQKAEKKKDHKAQKKAVHKPAEKTNEKKVQDEKLDHNALEKAKDDMHASSEKITGPDKKNNSQKNKEPKTAKKADEVILEHNPELKEEKKGFFAQLFNKKDHEIKKTEEKAIGTIPTKDETKQRSGILEKISETVTKVSLSEKKFDDLFFELEMAMLENNVAVEVIEKIKKDMKGRIVENKFSRKELETIVADSLRDSMQQLFDCENIDLIKEVKSKKPYVIVFIGINGSGKTTTLAKLIHLFKENHLEPVVGACDTFRAAAIQQLEEHTTKLGVKLIKHDYGADPAAVAYDTLQHAKAKNKDIVLIDTAGRLHSNKNLMQELEKVIRVVKPDLKIFIGESIAGNDVVEQVKLFNESVGIDAIILSKADTDEKGGAAISVSYITKKPILYLGTGQNYSDLTLFDKEKLIEQIGLA